MKRNKIQAVILLVVIAFPLFLYFFVKYSSTAHFERLPYQYSLDANGDTIFHELPEFRLQDQNGKNFGKSDMLGDVYLISFFDGAEDAHVSDKAARFNYLLMPNLKKVYDNAERAPMVKILTISTSPETDSLSVLKSWSDRYGGDESKWIFARGPLETVWTLGLNTFSLKEFMDKTRSRGPFTARAIALVDKEGKVRKYYEGTNDFSIEKQLFEDLRALLTLEYKEDFGK